MEKIKQFTLRFNTENKAEEEAMNYLHEKPYELGISQNAFLIKLLLKELKGNETEEKNDWIDRIVSGVSKQLIEQIKQSNLALVIETDNKSDATHMDVETVCSNEISEDAMDFLDSF